MIALRRPRPPAEPAGPALTAAGLTVARAGRTVLHEIDLTAAYGEVLALVGPNGAGKSTLLDALSGGLGAAAGEVALAGAPLGAWTHRELAMRRSVLPQRQALAFPFTVAEVVRMGRSPWSGTARAAADEDAVAEAMRDTGVAGLADRPVPALSGGEQARVALARVLAQRAAIVLLDEPTAALDVRHRELVFAVAREQAALGRAVVVVVHDLDLAAAYADRVMVLAAGRAAACGEPAEVLTPDLLTEVYRHPIEVLPHPRTGRPLILPRRERADGPA